MDETASVIIPARNAADTLAEQLEGLVQQQTDHAWEVVVVDNGSTDATVTIATSFADRLELVVVPCARRGANAARNAGARVARGELLLFCDADDVVHPGWVQAMVAALGEHDLVGGLIDNDTFGAGHLPRHPPGVPVAAGFLPRAITANLGVRKLAWTTVGGFNEDYGYGCTDTEFCWRLQLAGHDVGYAEDAVVAYRHRGNLRSVAVKAYKTGRARGRLFRDFKPHGMRQPRLAGAVVRWARLVVGIPAMAFSKPYRWRWVNEAAGAAGRVVGSARFRVLYL